MLRSEIGHGRRDDRRDQQTRQSARQLCYNENGNIWSGRVKECGGGK